MRNSTITAATPWPATPGTGISRDAPDLLRRYRTLTVPVPHEITRVDWP